MESRSASLYEPEAPASESIGGGPRRGEGSTRWRFGLVFLLGTPVFTSPTRKRGNRSAAAPGGARAHEGFTRWRFGLVKGLRFIIRIMVFRYSTHSHCIELPCPRSTGQGLATVDKALWHQLCATAERREGPPAVERTVTRLGSKPLGGFECGVRLMNDRERRDDGGLQHNLS